MQVIHELRSSLSPFYQDEYVTIYNTHCLKIMSKFVSGTVITDPPYNVGYHYEEYEDKLDPKEYLDILSVSCRLPSVVIHYPEDICSISMRLKKKPSKIVAWIYNSNTARQWRSIAWWGCTPDFTKEGQKYKNPSDKRIAKRIVEGRKARLYDWWEIDQVKNISKDKTDHPCQLPISLMYKILKITESDLIIDPFMGSGTTLVAAKKLKRKAIGIEISRKYCNIAVQRLKQEMLF